MGCASSTLLNRHEEFPQIGAFSHHIVSLTSTTYGFLTLDNPPLPPPSDPALRKQPLETINSWDLMSGLDSDDHVPSFRHFHDEENVNPNTVEPNLNGFAEKFERKCPPNGDNRAVLYSTSLRGVRKTFEDCETVRSALRGLGIPVLERDISMDRGFRDELRDLMKGKGMNHLIPPRLFVNGRYVGGVVEVMTLVNQDSILQLLQGLPKLASPRLCEGCGGVGFLPCFTCYGSCKIVKEKEKEKRRSVVVKCGDCNENGLVLCPICSL